MHVALLIPSIAEEAILTVSGMQTAFIFSIRVAACLYLKTLSSYSGSSICTLASIFFLAGTKHQRNQAEDEEAAHKNGFN